MPYDTPLFRSRNLGLSIALIVGLFLPTAEAAAGDEIYTVLRGELLRLSVDSPATRTPVGALTISPSDLTFTPEDELLALERDGAIHRIDLETASSTLLRARFPDSEFVYWHITAAPAGKLYLARSVDGEGQRPEWVTVDLETGQETLIDQVHLAQDRTTSPIKFFPILAGDSLIGIGRFPGDVSRLYALGPGTAGATPLRSTEGLPSGPWDIDSDGDIWRVSDPPVTPPSYSMGSVDPLTFENNTNKASYSFGTSFPGPYAVRRGDRQTCTLEGDASLCLLNGRYRVTATWEGFQGQTGIARVVRGATDNTGLLWFFSDDNWELMVKVLDGCLVNNRVWAFISGTTNVGYTVTVTDTVSGAERVFVNPPGRTSDTVLDTDAFQACAAAP